MVLMVESTLVVVYKKPCPGVGKQRLAAQLGAQLTLDIAQALLACVLADARQWPGAVVLAPASGNDTQWAQRQARRIGPTCCVTPQINGNLGQRLNALDATLRQRNRKKLVFIGSDAPGLNEDDFQMVRDRLQTHDVVLIPAEDGGVVLMAGRKPWPDLSALPWSTPQLGVALTAACRAGGLSVTVVRQGYDIDEADDFFRLTDLLASDSRPERRALHALAVKTAGTMIHNNNRNHA